MASDLSNNVFSFGTGFAMMAAAPIALTVAHVSGTAHPSILKASEFAGTELLLLLGASRALVALCRPDKYNLALQAAGVGAGLLIVGLPYVETTNHSPGLDLSRYFPPHASAPSNTTSSAIRPVIKDGRLVCVVPTPPK